MYVPLTPYIKRSSERKRQSLPVHQQHFPWKKKLVNVSRNNINEKILSRHALKLSQQIMNGNRKRADSVNPLGLMIDVSSMPLIGCRCLDILVCCSVFRKGSRSSESPPPSGSAVHYYCLLLSNFPRSRVELSMILVVYFLAIRRWRLMAVAKVPDNRAHGIPHGASSLIRRKRIDRGGGPTVMEL